MAEPAGGEEHTGSRARHRPGIRRVLLRAGVQVLVAALAWPVACYPADPGAADARGHWLGPGPAVSAYPWSREPDPAAEDAWGFLKRQCTSYAAWFLNSHGVPFARPTRGPRGEAVFLDGDDWEHAATLAGFPVSHHPVVGSIAQWHAWEASPPPPRSRDVDRHRPYRDQPEVVGGPYGHVAVVTTVLPDDSVLVAGYDGEERQLELLHTRAPRYLYIGVGSTGSLAPT